VNELARLLADGPVFCFGSDLDWNSDAVVRDYLSVVRAHGGKATAFATHKTAVLDEFKDILDAAVHPNFLPGSTHGNNFDEVIDHCFGLYPEAKTFRSHSYFDNQVITEKMAARGIRYDANVCLYRQAKLMPLRHCHIDMRIPSWFDDNIHWFHNGSWRLSDLRRELETPGLKVINFHPPTVALNLASKSAYDALRGVLPKMEQGDLSANRFDGHGPRTFLIDLLEWIGGRYRTMQFSEIYEIGRVDLSEERLLDRKPVADVSGRPKIDTDYSALSETERMQKVREQYNSMSAKGRYATSRDYNNREIELDIISMAGESRRVLDLGCGNGYTALSLASKFSFERIVGVDFSETMIAGANDLMAEEFENLRKKPEFVCANVFDYIEQVKPGEFDFVLTERLVVNLPSVESQIRLVHEILDRLPSAGRLLLVEGSAQGFAMLNKIREKCGLAAIPDRYAGNESSNKIDESVIRGIADGLGDVVVREMPAFSFYSLASKVLHPLIVRPEEPKFSSIINDRSREVQNALNALAIEMPTIGAATTWLFEKK
jgi:SAM-dependent methyltransferase